VVHQVATQSVCCAYRERSTEFYPVQSFHKRATYLPLFLSDICARTEHTAQSRTQMNQAMIHSTLALHQVRRRHHLSIVHAENHQQATMQCRAFITEYTKSTIRALHYTAAPHALVCVLCIQHMNTTIHNAIYAKYIWWIRRQHHMCAHKEYKTTSSSNGVKVPAR
jgi:hypothetical protein